MDNRGQAHHGTSVRFSKYQDLVSHRESAEIMVSSSRSYMTLISILLCNPCRGPCGLSLNICIEKLNLLPFRYGGSVKNNGKRNTKVLSFSQNERQRAEWSRAWTYQYNENKLTWTSLRCFFSPF